MITNRGKYLFSPAVKVKLNTPRKGATYRINRDMSKYPPPGSSSWTWAEPQAAFNNGTLAMAIEKGPFLSPFEKESGRPAKDLGVAPIPEPPNGQRGSIYCS